VTTTLSNAFLTAKINHKGAELCSLIDTTNKEYIWNGNPLYWGKHSPILFPIVGTLKNNKYLYNEKEYELSRHGFARDLEFILLEKSENSATFSLVASSETKEKYPFDFELHLIYTLDNKTLKIAYKVINNGLNQMPFSIGAHPAFDLPDTFEKYSLQFENEEPLHYFLLEEGLISNQKNELPMHKNELHLNYSLFEKDALVFKKINSKTITILNNSKPYLKVNYEGFPDLGIWTPPNAPFICIEPWFGYSDTLEQFGSLSNKEGIQILDSQGTFISEFSIEIL
jgi:galactose mutarotase-like enzyme